MGLLELIDNVQKGDKYALELVIDIFEPKINSLMKQTKKQNKDDLRQELYLVLIKKSQEYNLEKIPNINDFMKKKIG